MKEYSRYFIRTIYTLALVILVQSCGGSSDADIAAENYAISVDTSVINFSNEFLKVSEDTVSITVDYTGKGLLLGYAPDNQPVGWLNFSTEQLSDSSAKITVKLVNADNILPDEYSTTLRVSTGDANQVNLVHHDIDISLLIWQLTTNTDQITFQATLGEENIDSQTLEITSESNNAWTASVDVDWLTLDKISGEGASTITLSADVTTFDSANLYQAQLTLTETSSGDSKVIPVELGLDRHYLYSSHTGIAFSQVANLEKLSQQVSISTNSPNTVNWRATASAPWLTLTPSSDTLTVAINNNVVLNDGLHTSTVTIASVDDNDAVAETINVSFYVNSVSIDNQVIDNISLNNNSIVTSTYLPYVYLAQDNSLYTYHIHTGEQVNMFAVAPENTLLEQLVLSPNGETLLAIANETVTAEDGTETPITHRYKINLLDNTINTLTDSDIEFEPVSFITVSGREFVVTQALEFATIDLKRVFWDSENAFFTSLIKQANITETVYALDLLDSSFKRYTLKANDFTSQQISAQLSHQYRPTLLGDDQAISDFVVTDNEQALYTVSPTSEWISFDGNTYTDQGLLPQAEGNTTLQLVKTQNNSANYVRFDPNDGFLINIYDQQQQLSNTLITEGNQPLNSVLSADDTRMLLYINSENQLELVNLQ
ncbi:BACON domain-containing protein [Thalassotalea sp. PP2-459]|uniref:BACON domain-containing protein n=1 Tax=Thalassotalea sp. PP2-459 TaxID=1742724 RepID=UPI00094536DE|nr:BACON domain-containing protein [Thalassotalea sp. PP2-459]